MALLLRLNQLLPLAFGHPLRNRGPLGLLLLDERDPTLRFLAFAACGLPLPDGFLALTLLIALPLFDQLALAVL